MEWKKDHISFYQIVLQGWPSLSSSSPQPSGLGFQPTWAISPAIYPPSFLTPSPSAETEDGGNHWTQSKEKPTRDSEIVSFVDNNLEIYISLYFSFRNLWKEQRNNKPIIECLNKKHSRVLKYCARSSRCAWNWNYKDETFDKWLFRSSNSIKFMGDLQITTLFSAQYFGCKNVNSL